MTTQSQQTLKTPSGVHPIGTQPTRVSNDGDLQLTTVDHRPHHQTVADVVQLTMDEVAVNLLNARLLAGRASGIPTLDMLMTTWRRCGQRPQQTDRGTQTDSGLTPSVKAQTEVTQQDDGRALVRWAVSATPIAVQNHPLLQIALDRGIVVTPPRPQSKPARARRVRTKASLKKEPQVRTDPPVADLITWDEDQEDVLRITQYELPSVDMLTGGWVDFPEDNGDDLYVQ